MSEDDTLADQPEAEQPDLGVVRTRHADAGDEVTVNISGTVTGQIAVGEHILQVNADHGAVVHVAIPEDIPVPQLRTTPVRRLPRRSREIFGREDELAAARDSLAGGSAVEVDGPDGIGKTSLLRSLAWDRSIEGDPIGVVYARAQGQSGDDILQFVFDALYQVDVRYKPTPGQLREFLQRIGVVLLLDDVELERTDLEAVLDVIPSCRVAVASEERRLWGDVRAIELPGLPFVSALQLVERELGRPLEDAERETFPRLVADVGGSPLALIQAAARARASGEPFGSPPQIAVERELSEDERGVEGLLQALGAPIALEHASAISGVHDIDRVAASLAAVGSIRSDDGILKALTGQEAS